MKKIICKMERPELIKIQLNFFADIGMPNIPEVLPVSEGRYDYTYVEGGHPSTQPHLGWAYRIAATVIWRDTGAFVPLCDVRSYIDYVAKRYYSTTGLSPNLDVLETVLCTKPLKKTKTVHGDFTLENIVISPDHIVFIDPGNPHGMICREQDEAKMLQSIVTRWEELHRGWKPSYFSAPFTITPVHICLLACHWMRLLAHPTKHSEEIQIYGTKYLVPMLLRMI